MPKASLKEFAQDSRKYKFSQLPEESCRLQEEEIEGTDNELRETHGNISDDDDTCGGSTEIALSSPDISTDLMAQIDRISQKESGTFGAADNGNGILEEEKKHDSQQRSYYSRSMKLQPNLLGRASI